MEIDHKIKEDCNYKITLFKNGEHHFVTSEDNFADATTVAANLNIITKSTSRVVSKRNDQILAEFEGKEESKSKDEYEYELCVRVSYGDQGGFTNWIEVSNEKLAALDIGMLKQRNLLRKIKK